MIGVLGEPVLALVTVVVLAGFVAGAVVIVYMLTGHLVAELVARKLIFVAVAVFVVEAGSGHCL